MLLLPENETHGQHLQTAGVPVPALPYKHTNALPYGTCCQQVGGLVMMAMLMWAFVFGHC